MLYNIVDVKKSLNNQVCYYLYRHDTQSESGSVDTYGICACDVYEKKLLNDVLTDMDSALELFNVIVEKSVAVNAFDGFVKYYIDNL